MSRDDQAAIAMKAALTHAGDFLKNVLHDEAIVAWIADAHVQRLIASGELVAADDLRVGVSMRTVPEGHTVVPTSTIDRLKAEVDELRTLTAEHLAGNDRAEQLTALIEGGIDLTGPRPPEPARTEPAQEEPDPAPPGPDDDDVRRPDGMPAMGETHECSFCGTPVPGDNDREDQALLSYIRLRAVACRGCHDEKTLEMRR